MARFNRIDTSKNVLLKDIECYLVKGTLSLDDVSKLNGIKREIVLVFENTKGQNSGVIGNLNPRYLKISVLGGYDYLHKNKYNKEEFIEKTFYTPKNIANIIKTFESIERKIPYSWNETMKCMFYYKSLVERMHFRDADSNEYENGLDVARTLNSMLANRCNYSGAALIFKEGMDRLGILCHYQSIVNHHAWNAVNLDGKMYLVDITWDICNKEKNQQCVFNYFCKQGSDVFYSNAHHDIFRDNEEIRFHTEVIDKEKQEEYYKKICDSFVIYSNEMQRLKNSDDEEFNYLSVGETKGLLTYIVRQGEDIDYYYINSDADIRRVLKVDLLTIAKEEYHHNLSRDDLPSGIKLFKKYVREDGTCFLLFKTNARLIGDVNEYILIEPAYLNNKKVLRRYRIISESDLTEVKDERFDYIVANGLLSNERLEKKVKYYNGYVGFVSKNYEMFYNRDFETSELGIQNRE